MPGGRHFAICVLTDGQAVAVSVGVGQGDERLQVALSASPNIQAALLPLAPHPSFQNPSACLPLRWDESSGLTGFAMKRHVTCCHSILSPAMV